jgi:probable rRNA maturation factor
MSTKVETFVQIKNPAWLAELPDVETLCQVAASAAWDAALDLDGTFEATIVLAEDAFIQDLNRDFRQQDKPTNVLSFPGDNEDPQLAGDVPSLGDVVIAFETTKAEAPGNFSNHLSHLVVHGCLHVLGYDHEDDDAQAEKMEQLETKILAGLGVEDPYGEAI